MSSRFSSWSRRRFRPNFRAVPVFTSNLVKKIFFCSYQSTETSHTTQHAGDCSLLFLSPFSLPPLLFPFPFLFPPFMPSSSPCPLGFAAFPSHISFSVSPSLLLLFFFSSLSLSSRLTFRCLHCFVRLSAFLYPNCWRSRWCLATYFRV